MVAFLSYVCHILLRDIYISVSIFFIIQMFIRLVKWIRLFSET